MPFSQNTLTEIDQSVLRPVVMDIVSQIKQQTGIAKNIPVYFPGDIGVVAPSGTELGATDKENTALFTNQKSIRIEVEQDYDLPDINTTPLYQSGSTPIFVDYIRGVTITPIYFNTDVVIKFKYSTNSKAEAFKWRDDIRLRASQHGDINLHKLHYHYGIPSGYLTLLKTIYDLKQAVVGDANENFNQYLQRYFDDRLTVVTDTIGQDFQYVIKETQTRVQGIYGFDAVPDKPSRDDASGSWTIEFEYKVSFERPSVVRIDYPVMVHQSLLPMQYLTYITDKSYDYNRDDNIFSGYRANLRHFERDVTSENEVEYVINLPSFDIFNPQTELTNSPAVLTVLCSLTPSDKRTLFNLTDLGDLVFDPSTVDYLKAGDWQGLCKPYRTVYTASIYENNKMMPVSTLECDSALNIRSTIDLDLQNIYRVVISVNADASMVIPDSIERLVEFPNALQVYLELCYSNIHRLTGLTRIPIKNRSDLNLTYWLLTGKPLIKIPIEYIDHPSTIPGYIVENSNISKDMKEMIRNTTARITNTTNEQVLNKYGLLDPFMLLAARNELIVTPRVMRYGVVVNRKE